MSAYVPISTINEAVIAVAAELPARVRAAMPWRAKQECELWRELVAAILGSAVSYEHALSALSSLERNGLTLPSSELGDRHKEIERALRCAGYRFPSLRARQVAASAAAIYGEERTLSAILQGYGDAISARRGLVALCPGLGPKQASLFLRNVGYMDLAVLDRHVLTYLQLRGLLHKSVVSVSSLRTYEMLERIVSDAAAELGLTVADFDLSVWVTVRTAGGSNLRWQS